MQLDVSCMFVNTVSVRELRRDTLASCADRSSVATTPHSKNTFHYLIETWNNPYFQLHYNKSLYHKKHTFCTVLGWKTEWMRSRSGCHFQHTQCTTYGCLKMIIVSVIWHVDHIWRFWRIWTIVLLTFSSCKLMFPNEYCSWVTNRSGLIASSAPDFTALLWVVGRRSFTCTSNTSSNTIWWCLPKAAFVQSDLITLEAECWTNCKQSESN